MKKDNNQVKNIIKGIAVSFVFTILFLVIFSLILAYTNVSENVINPVIIVITGISILLGSSIGNIKNKRNGLLNGSFVGFGYMLIIYLSSSILNNDFSLSFNSIIFIIIGIICGILGGIIGVNKKTK